MLLSNLALSVNQNIKSRVTDSVITRRLNLDDMKALMLSEFDQIWLGYNTFTQEALKLIVRSADGVLKEQVTSVSHVFLKR